MTLYLKAVIGGARYLIAAAQIIDVAPEKATGDGALIDCRLLFDAPAAGPGHRLMIDTGAGQVGFVVDAIDGLVELDDDSFRPLPPIGRFGAAINAVSVPAGDEAPALRLGIGPALLAEAAGG